MDTLDQHDVRGADDKPHPRQNHLLAALSPEVQARLFPHLELVKLPLPGVVHESSRPINHVYFPTNSVVLERYITECGGSTAILVVGNEGVLSVTVLLGAESALSQSLVQRAGYAYRLHKRKAREELDHLGQLMMLMLSYTQAQILQVCQTALCNQLHTVDQQLCRWLLLSLDRQSSSRLTISHETIVNILGGHRKSVTEAVMKLKVAGAISYRRGTMEVHDRLKLEALSCECYDLIKKKTATLLN